MPLLEVYVGYILTQHKLHKSLVRAFIICEVLKMEFFKEIVGFEGLYRISNYGRIISISKKIEMKQRPNDQGYMKVSLCKDNVKKRFFVHRLVALTFLPNPNNYPCINHKDGNKQNNRMLNLEWCTHSQNIQHSYDKGLRKTKMVGQYDNNGNLIKVYKNCYQASKETGIDYHTLYFALRGVYKYIGGCNWYYVEKKH